MRAPVERLAAVAAVSGVLLALCLQRACSAADIPGGKQVKASLGAGEQVLDLPGLAVHRSELSLPLEANPGYEGRLPSSVASVRFVKGGVLVLGNSSELFLLAFNEKDEVETREYVDVGKVAGASIAAAGLDGDCSDEWLVADRTQDGSLYLAVKAEARKEGSFAVVMEAGKPDRHFVLASESGELTGGVISADGNEAVLLSRMGWVEKYSRDPASGEYKQVSRIVGGSCCQCSLSLDTRDGSALFTTRHIGIVKPDWEKETIKKLMDTSAIGGKDASKFMPAKISSSRVPVLVATFDPCELLLVDLEKPGIAWKSSWAAMSYQTVANTDRIWVTAGGKSISIGSMADGKHLGNCPLPARSVDVGEGEAKMTFELRLSALHDYDSHALDLSPDGRMILVGTNLGTLVAFRLQYR